MTTELILFAIAITCFLAVITIVLSDWLWWLRSQLSGKGKDKPKRNKKDKRHD